MRALSPTLGVDLDGVGDSVHEAACACCAYACDMHMQGPCPTLPPWGLTKPINRINCCMHHSEQSSDACHAGGGRCQVWGAAGSPSENQMGTRDLHVCMKVSARVDEHPWIVCTMHL